jgi:hypothetical protein
MVLVDHFAAVENRLLCSSRVPANAGHAIHKGAPREAFVREFLADHLGTRAAVGTGEIIDAKSRARTPRNQIDVVVYKSEFPKIYLGGGVHAFLAESVIATIEVKSTLTKNRLEKAVKSSIAVKKLQPCLAKHKLSTTPIQRIVSFVVAYSGPSKSKKILDWLVDIDVKHGINGSPLPSTGEERFRRQSGGVEVFLFLEKIRSCSTTTRSASLTIRIVVVTQTRSTNTGMLSPAICFGSFCC